MAWQRAIMEIEIPVGKTRSVAVDGERILVCRTSQGELFAVEDRCSHDGARFENDSLHECVLVCPRHAARFNVADGAALSMPATAPIMTFPVRRADNGWIEVDVEP